MRCDGITLMRIGNTGNLCLSRPLFLALDRGERMLQATAPQIAAIVIVVTMLAAFIWDRWRYDVVALTALLAAVAVGIVPQDAAFEGFADTVIVVIAAALVVSKAIAQSGILDRLVRRLLKNVDSTHVQVGALCLAVALLSAFVKNVGTLSIFIPIAFQVARRTKRSASLYLMPLAFASLIGGTITQIGTSPNLLISTVRVEQGGAPFRLFDYAWVGLPLTCIVVAFLTFGWRLLPTERRAAPGAEDSFSIENYTTELQVSDTSAFVGKTVGELEKANDDVVVLAIIRDSGHNYIPSQSWPLSAGDILAVRAEPAQIKAMADQAGLTLVHARDLPAGEGRSELAVAEAVVTATSPLIGQTPRSLSLRRAYDVNLLAISRAGRQRGQVLQSHTFQVGDVVVLQGWETELPGTLSELGLLPLADRSLALGKSTDGLVSLAVLAVALVLIATKVVNVAIGFTAAALIVVLLRQITLKTAYESIEGPVLVLLAALIPIAKALQTTGVTDIIGQNLATVGAVVPAFVAVGLMLATAMIVTPFLNNAAAVLVLGPVAAVVAKSLGYNAEPFLMAVALGCACDFLTPIGHQNNLLVMGPGGYKFTDYWRLGLPISALVLVFGTPLIMLMWPLS